MKARTLSILRNAFAPNKIAGLKLWLRADKGTYTDVAMTTPAVTDAAVVAAWADQSGQGNHVTQGTAGNRPVLKLNIQGGRSVLRFTYASTHFLETALGNTIPQQAPFTAFAVVKTDSGAPAGDRKMMAHYTGANNVGWGYGQYAAKGTMRHLKCGVANMSGVMPGYSTSKFEIVTMKFDTTYDTTFYINGGKRDYLTSAADSLAGAAIFRVGIMSAANQSWGGDIAEIIIYSAQLSDTQRNQVENYLLKKYVITPAPSLNVSTYYSIPDYPALGTVVHPDILYFASPWNGYKYWMAYTPYPPSGNENPSIAVSNDGLTWITPPGLTNPIDDNPGGGANNSDASLCMSEDGTTTMYIIWREYKAVTNDKIYLSSSADGVTWAAPSLILEQAINTLMSPSVLWDGAQFLMYVCDPSGSYLIDRYVCATIDGAWAADAAPSVLWANPHGLNNKHVDVILSGGVYYMIFMDVDNTINAGLYFATSADGITFTLDPNFRIPAQVGAWDYLPYRASLVLTGTVMDIYYSAADAAGTTFKIGKTQYTLPT